MPYPDDLIAQARSLAAADPTRPRQASLRRAVSAAYYALFHETIERATAAVLSNADAVGPIGDRLRRIVDHRAALRAAKWFVAAPAAIPASIQGMRSPGPQHPIPPALQRVCARLVALQAERHRADYDLSEPFSRAETMRLITDAESAISDLRNLPARGDTLILFLGCILGDGLTRNA